MSPQKHGQYAIITAVDAKFWPEYCVLYESLRRFHTILLTVIDVGLEPDQLHILSQQTNVITHIVPDNLYNYRNINRWMQWCKPMLILDVIHRHQIDFALWIDADTVITQELDPLLDATTQNFFVVADYFSPLMCQNDQQLYTECPAPVSAEHHKTVINSGVIGIALPRDRSILDKWIENTQLIYDKPHLQQHVAFYDQGILLLSLRQLQMLNHVVHDRRWNYPAKRNIYKPHAQRLTDTGNVIDEVILDNQDAIIVHYAGCPKLSELGKYNSPATIKYLRASCSGMPQQRVFCVGLERCGTRTIAEILRRGIRYSSWINYELQPTLSYEAWRKHNGMPYQTDSFKQRLASYGRSDTLFVCESNHRLGFFITDIYDRYPDAKFIIMLRDPLSLIRSRLLNFCTWPNMFTEYPGFYQLDIGSPQNSMSNSEQNQYRIQPNRYMPIIDMHMWEIAITTTKIFDQLRDIPADQQLIIWADKLPNSVMHLMLFIADATQRLPVCIPDKTAMQAAAQRRFNATPTTARLATIAWADQLIAENANRIIDNYRNVLETYNLRLPMISIPTTSEFHR